jgi:hypothetical protein
MRRKWASRVSVILVSLLILAAPSASGALPIPGQASSPVTQSGPLRLEDGTTVKIRLTRSVSSATAQDNDRIDFEVLEEVKVGNLTVIPKGSVAWGTVTEAQAKRRMGRGGKLDVTIDSVRLADSEKAALRGVKDVKGGGHGGAMTGGMVATSLIMWPAAPLFLLMHGKDVTIPEGTELTVYVNGDFPLDAAKFGGPPSPTQTVTAPAAAGAPTIVLVDPSVVDPGETVEITTPTLTIRGVVTDPSGIPAVTINANPVAMRPKGPQAAAFMSDPIQLTAGENTFEIVATDAAHVQAKFTFVARYTPSVAVPVRTTSPSTGGKGLTKAEVLGLLSGGVSSARVTEIVAERGISFNPTEDDVKGIRAAGGDDDLANGLMKAKRR